jgi:CubicO group peptidase (beta-lactamase class C family)
VEEGKLRWTTTVSEAFPELAPTFHPDFRNVSLLQLLSHRSGLPAPSNGPGADNPPVLGPAGTVHCGIHDWAPSIADQLRGARGKAALLSPESYRLLQTPHFGDDYSLGWGVVEREWAGGRALTHTGSNTLYLAVAWLAPARDFAVLVCANEGEDSAAAADEAIWRIIKSREE